MIGEGKVGVGVKKVKIIVLLCSICILTIWGGNKFRRGIWLPLLNAFPVDLQVSDQSLFLADTFNENYHHNAPQGYLGDIQSIIPHFSSDDKIDYWDVYALDDLYPSRGNIWYKIRTKDFKNFYYEDASNAVSPSNVSIPNDALPIIDKNNKFLGIDKGTNPSDITWSSANTGSIISNHGLLKRDIFGNAIDDDANLAFFSSDLEKESSIYLMYSNGGHQFRPYMSGPLFQRKDFPIKRPEFRDIFVDRNKAGTLIAYLAGGYSGHVYVLTSKDGMSWTYKKNSDIQLSGKGDLEIETPVLKTISGTPFMFLSWHQNDGKRGIMALRGYLGNDGIFQKKPDTALERMDGGLGKGDIYAGNYVNLDTNTLINVNWLGNWFYSQSLQMGFNRHNGFFALPRILTYEDGVLRQNFIEPQNKLISTYLLSGEGVNKIFVYPNIKMDMFFKEVTHRTIHFHRFDSDIFVNIDNNKISMRRRNNMNIFLKENQVYDFPKVNLHRVNIYVDNSSLELFFPEINKTFSILNFSSKKNALYNVDITGKAKVNMYQFGHIPEDHGESLNKKLSTFEECIAPYQEHNKEGDKRIVDEIMKDLHKASGYLDTSKSYLGNSDARGGIYSDMAVSSYEKAYTFYYGLLQNSGAGDNLTGRCRSFLDVKSENSFYVDGGDVKRLGGDGQYERNKFVDALNGSGMQYYVGEEGEAIKGSHSIDGSKYIFDDYGIFLKDTIVKNPDDKLSYYDSSGKLLKNSMVVHGYYLNIDGDGFISAPGSLVPAFGKDYVHGRYYLLGKNNTVLRGLQRNGSNTYYFGKDAVSEVNSFLFDSKGDIEFYFDKEGHMMKNKKLIIDSIGNGDGQTYIFLSSNGEKITGYKQVAGVLKYFDEHGFVFKHPWVKLMHDAISYLSRPFK